MASLAFIIWYALVASGLAAGLPSFVPEFLDIFIQLNAGIIYF